MIAASHGPQEKQHLLQRLLAPPNIAVGASLSFRVRVSISGVFALLQLHRLLSLANDPLQAALLLQIPAYRVLTRVIRTNLHVMKALGRDCQFALFCSVGFCRSLASSSLSDGSEGILHATQQLCAVLLFHFFFPVPF
jgi:hypothetical protein